MKLVLAPALGRWLPADPAGSDRERRLDVAGGTLGEALDVAFAAYPNLRGYVLDEQGRIRHHVAVFVDGESVAKHALDRALTPQSEIYVMQALSGG